MYLRTKTLWIKIPLPSIILKIKINKNKGRGKFDVTNYDKIVVQIPRKIINSLKYTKYFFNRNVYGPDQIFKVVVGPILLTSKNLRLRSQHNF